MALLLRVRASEITHRNPCTVVTTNIPLGAVAVAQWRMPLSGILEAPEAETAAQCVEPLSSMLEALGLTLSTA